MGGRYRGPAVRGAANVAVPGGIGLGFSARPAKDEETRRKFYDMASAERTLIAGFHFPFPSLGYVEKDGAQNYRLVPITWMPSI